MYVINKKTKSQLVSSTIADIVALTDLEDVLSNTVLDGIIKAISTRIAELYDDLEANFLAGYINSATGPYLDALAEDRGITRIVSTTTVVPCEAEIVQLITTNGSTLYSVLGISPTTKFVYIPKGHLITSTSDTDLVFELEKPAVILPTQTYVFLELSASLLSGQIIPSGTLNQMDYSSSDLFNSADLSKLSIVQTKNIYGVETIESDESLRNRLSTHLQYYATGNEAAIVSLIKAYSEVSDVIIERGIRGTGSYDLIVIPVRNRISSSFINKLQDTVNTLVSFGEDVRVRSPDYIPVSVVVSGQKSQSALIIALIQQFIETTSNKTISYDILKNYLFKNGVSINVQKLTINFRDILPSAVITLLPTELFELKSKTISTSAITVNNV